MEERARRIEQKNRVLREKNNKEYDEILIETINAKLAVLNDM